MRLTGNHIVWLLLISAFCKADNVKKNLNDKEEGTMVSADVKKTQTEKDTEPVNETDDESENLPILPPIILLDFDNGTESSSDEKSKRTIDGHLGYGINGNSLLSGKSNYYFPAGKTGTTVSIEESISPFLPKTIIERVPSSTARPPQSSSNNQQHITSFSDAHSYQYQYFQTPVKSQAAYGPRTKLQKVNSNGFAPQHAVPSSTPSSVYYTSSPKYQNSGYVSSTTAGPPVYVDVARYGPTQIQPAPFYQQHVKSQLYGGQIESSTSHPYYEYIRNGYFVNGGQMVNSAYLRNSPLIPAAHAPSPYNRNSPLITVSSRDASVYSRNSQSTPSPLDRSPYAINSQTSNLPKYTVENGVRYENKIYWKYPDGSVSDVAPPTYVETYSEYGPPSSTVDQSQIINKPAPSDTLHYETVPDNTNVKSQGPVQFPNVPGGEQETNYFISSESLATNPLHQHVYRLGYQSLIGQKPTAALAQQQSKKANSPSQSTSSSSSSSRYTSAVVKNRKSQKTNSGTTTTQQPLSRYMVNSPNPEYTDAYTTESPVKGTSPSPNLVPTAAPVETNTKPTATSELLNNYSNLGYSDLLKYNPSISQYVRDPSSILNVQPTFVQAGNSVIPVIILRVDGRSPVEPKVTPNVNLKALLQQYLLQYANNVQELEQPSNYDLGAQDYDKVPGPIQSSSSGLDLIGSYDSPYYSGSTNYDSIRVPEKEKNASPVKYGERTTKRQKVKNVQILENPRYPPY